MKKIPSEAYLEKAKHLTREEAERLLARMRGKLTRKLENRNIDPLEAVAIQLELEDEKLNEWRERWGEISARKNMSKDTD